MPVINILNDAERLLFDTPPRFSKEDRQRYFSIPSELKSSITRIHPIESRIGFILQLVLDVNYLGRSATTMMAG